MGSVWLCHSKSPQAWMYQYIEFRFSKRPKLKEEVPRSRSLPVLYDMELNLHNRYPLYGVRVIEVKRNNE